VAELKEIHDYRFESEVYDVSGQTLALSAMPRLLWLAHHRPDIYRQAATITMISDWLAAKLSGELAVDPPTPVPPACSTCSAATGDRRCSIWPGCVPIFSPRSKKPALCSAP
jgi:ribulose kinase